MSTAVLETRITPEELLEMPDGDNFELVDGRLVEREMGWRSSRIGGRLFRLLDVYCDQQGLGWVVPADASYRCFPDDPSMVRKPDVSFIRRDRLPEDEEPEGHCPIAPDLAVEVISPNELYYEVEDKIADYFSASVALIWIVNPATHSVRVHRRDGTISDLAETDELTGENVIPGFRCRVSEIFRTPDQSPGEKA
jgi:Uma2 family endonuclease